ncbi:hypothetical protein OPU71_01365 [Niveibacterium sp. 24ML]|uniref:hypothetical protein n=1 Tax=Niveibacterium sp. 24ML TaxID=2985512 RepID=UPI00226D50B9|nr:hypothetical protein [Niveibacterium sp. 24ML]MCX9154767.1 hypothetical protein [Niveibacterium sp. 24ML]
MLTACGGGGGGTEPPPPPPPAGATEISADNMNAVAAASIASANTADFSTGLESIGQFGSPTASGAIAGALQHITAALAPASAGPLPAARIAPPPELAMSPVPSPPEVLLPISSTNCPGGGSVAISIWDKNLNNQADTLEPFRLRANNCKDGNDTINGGFDLYVLSLTQANGVATSADLRAEFSLSTATAGGRSNYLFGTLRITMTSNAGRATTIVQGTPGWMQSEGDRFVSVVHDSYQASVSEQASGGSIVDFSSAARLSSVGVTRPIEGTLLTRTTTPIALAADGSIVSGSMRISAQGKPAVLDVIIANDVATLALDADGNGSIDTTRNLTMQELAKLF